MMFRTLFFAAALAVPALVLGTQARTVLAGEITSIAVMAPEEGTDYGWNQQGVENAKAAAAAHGIDIEVADGLGYGDVRPVLRELAAGGAGLIIAHASGYNTAAPEVGKEFNVPVAIVDAPQLRTPGLVADYTASGHEGAYLAGILAAKMTRTDTLGIVVSGEPPSWNIQSAAFAQGARSVKKDIELRYAVIGPAAYADVAGGKRVTESVIAAGADIIFGQGDGSSFGMIQAVETNQATDGGKVWFIDVIGDKTALDKGHLLSSVLWDFTPLFNAMIDDVNAGTYGQHNYDVGLANGSISLLKTKYIPDDVWSDVMAVQDKILSGELKIKPEADAAAVRKLMSAVEVAAE